jgi:AAA ATPase-like protein
MTPQQQLALRMTPEQRLELLGQCLSPENPIRLTQFLKGRDAEFASLEQELRYFGGIPFIFGNRGVGKTSLARTVAQQISHSDREHIYVPCAPGARMLNIFREIALELLNQTVRLADKQELSRKLEINLSMNPGIKLTVESRAPKLDKFEDVNMAVRTLREIDALLPNARQTVVIIDELEELNDEDRKDLAFLVKQAGDQRFAVRFMLVGIAENVHELIGAHESVPRYITEVSLDPLVPQVLIDIVTYAAEQVGVVVDENILYRIAIIGNGYPHFAHLMGKTILAAAISNNSYTVTPDIYSQGVKRAVKESIQQLRMSYEAATQRRDDTAKHLLWALAHSDTVDVRIDDWVRIYRELAVRYGWPEEEEERVQSAIQRLNTPEYGSIVSNTPLRYGSSDIRYRYKRFSEHLMRGHVRLQAEQDDVQLGQRVEL